MHNEFMADTLLYFHLSDWAHSVNDHRWYDGMGPSVAGERHIMNVV